MRHAIEVFATARLASKQDLAPIEKLMLRIQKAIESAALDGYCSTKISIAPHLEINTAFEILKAYGYKVKQVFPSDKTTFEIYW